MHTYKLKYPRRSSSLVIFLCPIFLYICVADGSKGGASKFTDEEEFYIKNYCTGYTVNGVDYTREPIGCGRVKAYSLIYLKDTDAIVYSCSVKAVNRSLDNSETWMHEMQGFGKSRSRMISIHNGYVHAVNEDMGAMNVYCIIYAVLVLGASVVSSDPSWQGLAGASDIELLMVLHELMLFPHIQDTKHDQGGHTGMTYYRPAMKCPPGYMYIYPNCVPIEYSIDY